MKGKSKFWGKFQYVSEKQIEVVVALRCYRRNHNLSQTEMAKICNLYSGSNEIKFTRYQIGQYERFEHAPRKAKYKILCSVLSINPTID